MRLATKTALITGGNSGIGLRRTSPDGHGRVHTASGGKILRTEKLGAERLDRLLADLSAAVGAAEN